MKIVGQSLLYENEDAKIHTMATIENEMQAHTHTQKRDHRPMKTVTETCKEIKNAHGHVELLSYCYEKIMLFFSLIHITQPTRFVIQTRIHTCCTLDVNI